MQSGFNNRRARRPMRCLPANERSRENTMDALEKSTMAKVTRRLLPFLIVCYLVCYLDRVNVSFAALQMNKDLGFTAAVYGFGAGIFFIPYFLLETPSNLLLVRFGARRWIARIMFTWGLLSALTAFVWNDTSFYVIRFLLGAAEAGFFPGILFYLTLFFPAAYRARMVGLYMAAIPLSAVIGAPLSSFLLYLDGGLGLKGWQWIFITEAVPTVLLSLVVLTRLTDDPKDANWLAPEERSWLIGTLGAERRQRLARHDMTVRQVLLNPRVLLFGVAGFAIAHSISGISFFLPQIVKAFGLTNMQTGLVSAIPFAIGAAGMILYGRRSDRVKERRSHCGIALLCTAIGLVGAAMLDDPYLRLAALCFASFGAFAVLPVFWAMPTAFLSGAAAAAGVAYINSIANVASFVGPFVTGWIKDATGSFSGGLLVIATTQIIGAIAILCIEHDASLEKAPQGLLAE